jgi:hypothetical protein
VDCIGLICGAWTEIGFQFKDFTAYSMRPSSYVLIEKCELYADRIKPSEIEPGDLGLFWLDSQKRYPQHICVFSDYAGGLGMIHSHSGAGRPGVARGRGRVSKAKDLGSVVEHAYMNPWKNRLVTALRLKGAQPWQP